MSEVVFMQTIGKHIQAIRLCIDNKLFMPALVLIYSGIDFVSALGRPASKTDAQRSDFITWVDRYMPCDKLSLTGADLYGARCGIVHAMTSESRLQREGKVKRVFYTWGTARPEPLNNKLRGEPGVFVKVEFLFDVFLEGLAKFGDAVSEDATLYGLITQRTNQIFAEYSSLDRQTVVDLKNRNYTPALGGGP
jgi:hypothetical protein